MDPRGVLTMRMTDRRGEVVGEYHFRNRIVKSGRLMVAQLFASGGSTPPPAPISHIAVGTDGTAPADGQTALGSEKARKALTDRKFEEFTDSNGLARVRVVLTTVFTANDANGNALQEAGAYNAATNGVMYNRVVFPPVTKTTAFELTLLWNIEF